MIFARFGATPMPTPIYSNRCSPIILCDKLPSICSRESKVMWCKKSLGHNKVTMVDIPAQTKTDVNWNDIVDDHDVFPCGQTPHYQLQAAWSLSNRAIISTYFGSHARPRSTGHDRQIHRMQVFKSSVIYSATGASW